jgi:hypothetical protein
MNINLFPFAILWMLLAVVVVALIVYRKWISKDEEDSIHVMDGEAGRLMQQTVMAEKLNVIDKWGKTLTVVVLVYGLAMASIFLYKAWLAGETVLR